MRGQSAHAPTCRGGATGTAGCAATTRAGRLRARLFRWAAVVCVLGLVTLAWCDESDMGSEEPGLHLVGMMVSFDDAGLNVQIITDGSEVPRVASVTRPNPHLLAVDLPGVALRPGYRPPSFSPGAGVKNITVRELSEQPPVTRIEFELSVRARDVRCWVHPPRQPGALLVRLATPGSKPAKDDVELGEAPAPPVTKQPKHAAGGGKQLPPLPGPGSAPKAAPAVKPARAKAIAAKTAKSLRTAGLALTTGTQAAGRKPPAQAPAAGAPEPAPAQPAAAPRAPAQAAPIAVRTELPRSDPERRDPLNLVLAIVTGAAISTAGWSTILLLRQQRRLRARVGGAAAFAGQTGPDSTLTTLGTWSHAELWAAADALLAIAHSDSHPAARTTADLLRRVFPAEDLLARARRGRLEQRLRAISLLGLHDDEGIADPLLTIAETAPAPIRRAAVSCLARLWCEQPLRAVLAGVASPSAARRAVAAEVFGEAGARAGASLRKALSDPDQSLRLRAVEMLVSAYPEHGLAAMVQALSDPAEAVRAAAARGLGTLGADSEARPHLLAALQDASAEVREEAGVALAHLAGEATDDLLAALSRMAAEDPDFRASERVVSVLAARLEEPAPAVQQALASRNRGFAQELARALERAGRLDMWLPEMAAPDPGRRARVTAILEAAAATGVTASLERGLESPEPEVSEICARLLGQTAGAGSVESLVSLLASPEESLRLAAADALGRMEGREAVAALAEALADPSVTVRCAACSSLTGPLARSRPEASRGEAQARERAARALVRTAQDPSASVRAAAAQALGTLGLAESAAVLVEAALRDPNSEVRMAATTALGQMGTRTALPVLLGEAVESDRSEVRARALEVLGRAGDPRSSDSLIGALQDADEQVRRTAARGLWDVVVPEQARLLPRFLNSPDAKVRAAVVGTLGKTGAPEWAPTLAAATSDPDPYVRAAAMNALGRIGEGASDQLEAVRERLADSDSFVRARAAEAAFRLSPESLETAREVQQLLRDPEEETREAAGRCLVWYAREGAVLPLIEALGESEYRESVLRALAVSEEGELHQVLRHVQQSASELSDSAADALLELLRERWTVEDLSPDLASLETEVRLGGLEALALIGGEKATLEIARLLESDPAREVRLRAAHLLGEHRDDAAAQRALRQAAETDADAEVQKAASASVGRESVGVEGG